MIHRTLITLRKSKIFIVILIVIMCTIIYPKSVIAEENKIIRVGFPSISGFTEKKMEVIQDMPMNI